MTGAIEFLQKIKAIQNIEGNKDGYSKTVFEMLDCIHDIDNAQTEADLVRKVMEYRLEVADD